MRQHSSRPAVLSGCTPQQIVAMPPRIPNEIEVHNARQFLADTKGHICDDCRHSGCTTETQQRIASAIIHAADTGAVMKAIDLCVFSF